MKKRMGFTLIELLIVIAIIAILAIIVLMNLQGSKAKANAAKAKSEMETIYKAVATSVTSGRVFGTAATQINIPTSATVLTQGICDTILDDDVAATSINRKLLLKCPVSDPFGGEYYVYATNATAFGVYDRFPLNTGATTNWCKYENGNFEDLDKCKVN